MMVGNSRIEKRISSLLRNRRVKPRTIVFGLKSDNHSRETLLQLLTVVVKPGDSVLAVHVHVHVQEQNDPFDLNTFHIHEDVCKSKQVDFLVKATVGDSCISELSKEVLVNDGTILALGCNLSGLKDSTVNRYLKALPPACTLLIIDNVGRILVQRPGTSQEGSTNAFLQSSLNTASKFPGFEQPVKIPQLKKSLTEPSASTSPSAREGCGMGECTVKETAKVPKSLKQSLLEKLTALEAEGSCRRFTSQELNQITRGFSPEMLIGQGGNSDVYRGNLLDGQLAAVKVLKCTNWLVEEVLREVELLCSIKHENIVRIIGYCHSQEMYAIVYNLLKGSLNHFLKQLKWNERMVIAIGVAKALEYLHHSCDPPIIHRDVKSSNILISESFQGQLSDFGAAMVHHWSHQASENVRPPTIVGTFGYLAPEYMMYGNVDEKTDVYAYGVVLLELITGKEAIQKNQTNHESLVLWARSLLSCGLYERLIDPHLNEDFNKEEMGIMVFAARLCLLHSSFRRPTMKMILRLFLEPEYWVQMQRERDELQGRTNSQRGQTDVEIL